MNKKIVEHVYKKLSQEYTDDRRTTQHVIATIRSPLNAFLPSHQYNSKTEQTEIKAQAKKIERGVGLRLLKHMVEFEQKEGPLGLVTATDLSVKDESGVSTLNLAKFDCLDELDFVEDMSLEGSLKHAIAGLFVMDPGTNNYAISNPKDYYLVIMTWDSRNVTNKMFRGVNLHQYISQALVSGK